MADHTTTTRRPATTAGTRTGSGTATRTGTATSRPTNSRTSRTTIVSPSTTISATSTPTPEPAGGLSGGAIGGIAGGVAVLFALVAFFVFKRRKRATVANSARTEKAGGPGLSANAMSGPISGPMALAPEKGIEATPDHRPEAKFREQQQFHPAMRDELFAAPGAGLQNSKSKTSGHGNGNNVSSNNIDKPKNDRDYYDDPVNDYFGDDHNTGPIAAQRSAPQPRDLTHGNLTPAPEYYLGKEDIDPRRDLRGMDTPDTYVEHRPTHTNGKGSVSRRSSFSSDGGNAHMTPDQAQKAHNNRMIGHKESIGSVQMLLEHNSPSDRGQDRGHGREERDRARDRDQDREMNRPNGPRSPGFASDAVSESTVSMMPALPPNATPMPFKGQGPRHGPNSPQSPRPHEDPYADSAFSSEDFDNRSLMSGPYSPYGSNNHGPPRHHQQSPPFHPSHGHGYGHQPYSPPFHSNQYPGSPPFHPNGRPHQPPRGGPPPGRVQGHGHGHGHGYNGPPRGGPPSPDGGYYGGGPPRGYNQNHHGQY
ncbi:hypothetical protein BGZ82_000054 [Podila clonocystis]|nr:hypothetical protein BGZ82_000054 [Podila clonocystis]